MQHATIARPAADATPAPVAVMIERAPLLAACTFLARYVFERRNTVPILSGILLSPVEAGVELCGSDLDLEARTTIAAAWDVPGELCPDVVQLRDALKAMTGDAVTLRQSGAGLTIEGEAGTASVACVGDPSDFPRFKPVALDAFATMTIPADVLALDWRRVGVAVSSEETRYYLNGIFAHVTEGDAGQALTFAATDGHRLAVVSRPLPAVTGQPVPDVVIPRKAIAATLAALGKKPAGDAVVRLSAARVGVEAMGWTFASKSIDGGFPDYTRVIPTANANVATIAGDALKALAAWAKPLTGKDATALRLTINESGAGAADIPGKGAATRLACHYAPASADEACMIFGVNAAYLGAFAGTVTGNAIAYIADGAAPLLFHDDGAPEYRCVIMPMRVEGATGPMPRKGARGHAPTPRVEPVASPYDTFVAAYRAAWDAGDVEAMRQALAVYRPHVEARPDGSLAEMTKARAHDQLAMTCASIRHKAAIEGGYAASYAARREESRLRRAVARDRALCDTVGRPARGSFQRIGERMRGEARQMAEHVAWMQSVGLEASDERPFLPVVLTDGTRRTVLASDARNKCSGYLTIVKADGTFPRGRVKMVGRAFVARVVMPKGHKRAQPAPVPVEAETPAPVAVEPRDVAPAPAPVAAPTPAACPSPAPASEAADVAAMRADVAALQAMVAALTGRIARVEAGTPATGRATRTERERRAIQRAWDMRAALRRARATTARAVAMRDEARDALAPLQRRVAVVEGLLTAVERERDDARNERDRVLERRIVSADRAARYRRHVAASRASEREASATGQQQLAAVQPLLAALRGLAPALA